jgi:hypothetical protein
VGIKSEVHVEEVATLVNKAAKLLIANDDNIHAENAGFAVAA